MKLLKSALLLSASALALAGFAGPAHASGTASTKHPGVSPATLGLPPGGCSGTYYTGGGSFGSDIRVYNCTSHYYVVDVYSSSLTSIGIRHYTDFGLAPESSKLVSVSSTHMVPSPGTSGPAGVVFTRIG